MSFAFNAGQFIGRVAADAVEGSRLVSTQFAQGASKGYKDRATLLREQRAAALAGVTVAVKTEAPTPKRQSKIQVAVKA